MDGEQRPATDALATGQLIETSQYKGAGDRPLVEQRQTALQRIQVGLVGLVVVLLFVSLANMVLDRVTDAPSASEAPGLSESGGLTPSALETPAEPLAELGVTPVAKEEEPAIDGETPPAPQNVRRAPTNQQR